MSTGAVMLIMGAGAVIGFVIGRRAGGRPLSFDQHADEALSLLKPRVFDGPTGLCAQMKCGSHIEAPSYEQLQSAIAGHTNRCGECGKGKK